MKKFYNLLFVFAIPAAFLLFTSEVLYHSGSPGGKTGSPGDGGQDCTSCHAGTAITQPFWISSGTLMTEGYVEGETYDIIVAGIDANANRFGFEATAEDAGGSKVGEFAVSFPGMVQTLNNGHAMTHTAAGSFPIADTGTVWFFNWVAPPASTGEITFYAAINAADGNGGNSGDQIYLSSFTASPSTVGVDEISDLNSFSVFPNPSDGLVNLSFNTAEEKNISVYNLTGKRVYSEAINGFNSKLNLTQLPEGVYFISEGKNTQRIILY